MADSVLLLVDAFRHEREMYAEYLAANGFRVASFERIEPAVAYTASTIPDVVVVRMRQPNRAVVADALMERLKANARTRHVPVVVISASPLAEDRDAMIKAGCDRYLLLPCLPDELLKAVRDVLVVHRRRSAS